jgi:LPS O-antigen subunit length determinant protein (WzzB/FepE family)
LLFVLLLSYATLALTAAGLPLTKLRVTLWITTAIHLDTPTKDLANFTHLKRLRRLDGRTAKSTVIED